VPTTSGPRNDLTDVAGLLVGHHQRRTKGWLTGTTVVVAPPGTVGAVDVRGGGPGTRETDLLDPTNLVSHVDAICLSGGSAYGLAAATGVVAWLAARHRGFSVGAEPHEVVPIVPGAVLFDLGAGGVFEHVPDASFGEAAAAAARSRPIAQGTVGAGTGAHAGGLKGGIGSASVVLESGITVAALVALNPAGSPVDPSDGTLYGARYGLPGKFALRTPRRADVAAFHALRADLGLAPLNTTLAIVATDARLDKHEAKRLAMGGHDGMARALRPVHQLTDGDVVFALATGTRELPDDRRPGAFRPPSTRPGQVNQLIGASADVVTRAIVHAVLAATSAGRLRAYRDVFPSAFP
jgi:putative pantetheine hydrolase